MEAVFLKLLNMSITAGWLVLAVMLLRLVLKKAPRSLAVVMWALVGIRLVCPWSIESAFSLIPSAQPIPEQILTTQPPAIHTGVPMLNHVVNPVLSETLAPTPAVEAPVRTITQIAALVWLVGMLLMGTYTLLSYLHIRRKVQTAMPLGGGLWLCDRLESPFILGLFRPRIYLPSDLEPEHREYVIAHEKAHLKRLDHLWKPLGFLLLSIHWFNPLLWLAYVLLCRDIEAACDEAVIRRLGTAAKKPYSQALLGCSVPRRTLAACPLAFGEVSVKSRIRGVLSYKKPAFWIIAAAVAACAALVLCFLTDPKDGHDDPPKETEITHPSEEIQEPTLPQPEDTAPVPLSTLRKKYPEYFGLSTDKGLEVYVWQMGKGLYSWGLKEGKNAVYTVFELWDLKGTSLSEMHAIVASYGLPKEEISIHPFCNPISSYAYNIDANYQLQVETLFWSTFPKIPEVDFGNVMDTMTFDIDGDGIEEDCTLGPGITSGLFSFTLSVYENGEPEYYNVFAMSFHYLRFERMPDGEVLLRGTTQGNKSQVHYFRFGVEDGNITLTSEDQPVSPLDTTPIIQGPSTQNRLELAIADAIQSQYTVPAPDGFIHTQSYVVLDKEQVSGTPLAGQTDHAEEVTVQLLVLHKTYRVREAQPEEVSGIFAPTVITFTVDADNNHALKEYRELPEDDRLVERYTQALTENCLTLAKNRLELDLTSLNLSYSIWKEKQDLAMEVKEFS